MRAEIPIEVVEQIGSTHAEMVARARAGQVGPQWLMAHEQSGGRGRLGRSWVSPRGNLYANILLPDPAPLTHLPELGFVAGVALHKAVSALTGLSDLALKWPNDLVSGKAKLSGMLMESISLGECRAVTIGFGVNLISSPSGLAYPTTHLLDLCARVIPPREMLETLSQSLQDMLAIWQRGAGFAAIRQLWLTRAAHLHQPITVRRHHDRVTGIFDGIDAHGRLMLRCEKESVTIEAGDVFLSQD